MVKKYQGSNSLQFIMANTIIRTRQGITLSVVVYINKINLVLYKLGGKYEPKMEEWWRIRIGGKLCSLNEALFFHFSLTIIFTSKRRKKFVRQLARKNSAEISGADGRTIGRGGEE